MVRSSKITNNKSNDGIYGNIHKEELRRIIAEELGEMLKK